MLNSVQEIFAAELKPFELRRKNLNWHLKPTSEVCCSVNLQASPWNGKKAWGRHTVVVYFRIRSLDSFSRYTKPGESFEANYRNRTSAVLLEDYLEVVDSCPFLDDETGYAPGKREKLIGELVNEKVFPIAKCLSTIEGILWAFENKFPTDRIFGSYIGAYLYLKAGKRDDFIGVVDWFQDLICEKLETNSEEAKIFESQLDLLLAIAKTEFGVSL